MNACWLLNKLSVVLLRGPGGQMTPKMKRENLLIIKCINLVYFIAGFVLK